MHNADGEQHPEPVVLQLEDFTPGGRTALGVARSGACNESTKTESSGRGGTKQPCRPRCTASQTLRPGICA
jgi:hypothetical protein